MKALALTLLTIFACLILANFLSGKNTSSSPNRFIQPTKVAAVAPTNPPQTLLSVAEKNSADRPLPIVTVESTAKNATAKNAAKVIIEKNAPVPTVVAAVSLENSPLQNVPVSSGDVAAPSAIDEAPVQAVAAAVVVGSPRVVAPATAEPVVESSHSPELDAFTANVTNGKAGQVVGVFVQDQLALPVVQQPDGQNNFVSVQNNTITQFSSANAYGTIGLLAHNFLSGRLFSNLKENQDVVIVYGDGRQEDYRITGIQSFQALDPASPYSNFIDTTDTTHSDITAGALFNRIYAHPNQVVLQTCIDANGNSSWGRLFITAARIQ
jgi:hypothetical protein